MRSWRAVTTAFPLCILLAFTVTAEPQYRNPLDVRAGVLDLLFPPDAAPKPYYVRLTLRFGDTNTQLVAFIYPGGACELVRHQVAGIDGKDVNGEELLRVVSKAVTENSHVGEREIAAKLKVKNTRPPLECGALDRAIDRLKTLRISPFLETRVAVDAYSQYDYWFDSGQESVHYTITGPFQTGSQDQLVAWMTKFRAGLGDSR